MSDLIVLVLLALLWLGTTTNAKQCWSAVDQWLNTLIRIRGDANRGMGYADELLSARAYRCYREGLIGPRLKNAIDLLFFWEPEHCFGAFLGEFDRRGLPGYYSRPNHDRC